jgi:dTDP-4-amino-4,6-dideoxygalactose transaminase
MIPIAEPDVGEVEIRRVEAVLESGALVAGDEVAAFESAFADYCGVAHGVATANGTAALHAALEAVGIEEGDTVLTTPFTFVATANVVRLLGAEPVFADIDPETYTLDPGAAEAVLRERDVDAIVVVHLYGCPAEMDRFRDLAARFDRVLVEDAAQAHGAEYDGQRVGSFGDAACFSFYPSKNITTGEGGMVVTDRAGVAERAARFVDHGRLEGYTFESVGHNLRLTDMAAAMGRCQLDRLPQYLAARRSNAATLSAALASTSIEPPFEPSRVRHAFNQYTVCCPDRASFRSHLDDYGVDSRVYYPRPVHEQPAYDGFDADAPAAEQAAREVLSLPVHPELSGDDLDTITAAIDDYG